MSLLLDNIHLLLLFLRHAHHLTGLLHAKQPRHLLKLSQHVFQSPKASFSCLLPSNVAEFLFEADFLTLYPATKVTLSCSGDNSLPLAELCNNGTL
ncbi:hypothetical protein H671_2g4833 [Cricetulus griseus]|nr:hypothetical protein H671_2g4833 [Cricetulus griseus]